MAIGNPGAVLVLTGLAEFQRALKKVNAQAADDVKHVLEDAAKPLARHATGLAIQRIPVTHPAKKHGSGAGITQAWAENRVGVTTKEVYIVPRKRGTKVPRRKRPNLGVLLIDRAYEPTRILGEPLLRVEMQRALDRIAHTLEHA